VLFTSLVVTTYVVVRKYLYLGGLGHSIHEEFYLLGYKAVWSVERHPFGGTRRLHLPPKHQLTCNGLHGIISQKIELFITTAVRT
jgi:hypothetical protein